MTVEGIIAAHTQDWQRFKDGESLTVYDSPLFMALYEFWLAEGEMPIGVARARTGDPNTWITDRLEAYLYGKE